MEHVDMDQLKKEMENAPSMDEAIDSIFGDNEGVKNGLLELSKQIRLMKNGLTTPGHIAGEFLYTYAALSTELSTALDTWMEEMARNVVVKNPNADMIDTYTEIVEAGVKNLAEVLGDFLTRYHALGKEFPEVATKLSIYPPKLKKVTDAYTALYNELNDAKEFAHQMSETFGVDTDEFDRMVMQRVLENESAGENNAQPAE